MMGVNYIRDKCKQILRIVIDSETWYDDYLAVIPSYGLLDG